MQSASSVQSSLRSSRRAPGKRDDLYRAFFEASPDPMWAFDPLTLEFLDANEAALRRYGYSREEFLSLTADDIRPAEEIEHFRARIAEPREGVVDAGTFRHRARDGSVFEVRVSSQDVTHGGRRARVVVAVDSSERNSLEAQLRHAQKMEAVGRLAGGVAHDFNNILTAISGYSQLLMEDLGPSDPRRQDAAEIQKAASRAAALTRQLLAFSRRQVLQPRVLDPNHLISEMEQFLRRLIGEDVELVVDLDSAVGTVRADPGQLEQVIMNLAVNARDAMPGGGRLTISTAAARLKRAPASRGGGCRGECVRITVRDTGHGMSPEIRAHIFEPFFTTKEKGQGTGLGLSTVDGIVEQSGGYIEVETRLGQGTAFHLYFPRQSGDAERRPALPPAVPRTGSATILLVEDEAAVRDVASEALRRRGYRVIEAEGAAAAATLAQRTAEPIHLLLTDVVLADQSGRILADQVVRTRPDTRVLFMSGYTDDAVLQRGVLGTGVAYLQKPFTPDVLVARIQEVLAGSEAPTA
ncbi:MAG TPA: ATP-binding protein [Gemmatimonadales bacterium]|nr:ATP-binding protein [Gemmatimonadales bacterium]